MSDHRKAHIRELIKNFVVKHPSVPKSQVVRRFAGIGVPRSTVYNVLNSYKNRGHVKNVSQGWKAEKVTPIIRERLIRDIKAKVGVSQRQLSKKYGIAQSSGKGCKMLKNKGVKYRKGQKGPDLTESQQQTQKTRLRKLTREILKAAAAPDIVMDDESYFTHSGMDMPSNTGYYAGAGDAVPNSVRIAPQSKFPKKLLVWIAISPRGSPHPFSAQAGVTSTADFTGKSVFSRSSCLSSPLSTLLGLRGYIFWPDLATRIVLDS